MTVGRDLVQEAMHGSPRAVVRSLLAEDARLVRRQDPSRVSFRRSRIAQDRFRRNRETYKTALAAWRRTPEGRSFYRKLARFNQRRMALGYKEPQSRLPLPPTSVLQLSKPHKSVGEAWSLAEFFQLVEFGVPRSEPLGEVASIAEHLKVEVVTELSDADAGLDYFDQWREELSGLLA